MEYKVVPFVANIQSQQGSQSVSEQLESVISANASEGWVYIRMENVETFIAGTAGCFGYGAQPSRMTTYSMIVFKKWNGY